MNASVFLTLAVIACLFLGSGAAQEPAKRAEWDQKKAVEMVKQVIVLEEKAVEKKAVEMVKQVIIVCASWKGTGLGGERQ